MTVISERSGPELLLSLLHAMRPKQWTKNILVAAAPLASGRLNEPEVLLKTVAALLCFCLAASAVYLVNDVRDLEADRRHPRKRYRPIAAGLVEPRLAVVTAACLAVASLVGAVLVNPPLVIVVGTYLGLQAGYALGLKHEPVLDIAVVAGGFMMRAVAGGVATDIRLSQYFLLVAGFGSLFMVAGKRYSEILLLGSTSGTRRSLEFYTETYLRFIWSSAAAVTITGYCLWAFSTDAVNGIAWEKVSIVPFVLGIYRYAVAVDAGTAGEPEDIVLNERVLQGLGVLWVGCVALGAFRG